jgi:hypothetical protein
MMLQLEIEEDSLARATVAASRSREATMCRGAVS